MTSKAETKNSKLVELLLAWFAQNARDLPWRRTQDPYAIWVSEIMLQQTQVKTVIPYWERWMRELPTIESLAKANPEKIHKLWEGLGYYTRVRNMQKAAQEICRRRGDESQIKKAAYEKRVGALPPHPGPLPRGEGRILSRFRKTQREHIQSNAVPYEFPNTFDEVLALPGIGRYTAGAICSIAFNQPTPILDGNVIRVLTRVFGVRENPRDKKANEQLWRLAQELVTLAAPKRSEGGCSHLNQSLMELGALICTPREPKCLVCPIAKHCFALQKNRVNDFPNLDKRPTATARRFAAFVVEHDGRFLVQQRPAGVVNAHLWEFPNIELNGEPVDASAAVKELFGFTPKHVRSLCTIKHSITRYRIKVEAFCIGTPSSGSARTRNPSFAPNRSSALQTRWLALSDLHKLSFPSAHGKILRALQATAS